MNDDIVKLFVASSRTAGDLDAMAGRMHGRAASASVRDRLGGTHPTMD